MSLRPRLPDLEDPADEQDTHDAEYAPAAWAYRQQPPSIGSGIRTSSAGHERQSQSTSYASQSDRFQLDLDSGEQVRAPIAKPNLPSMLRDITERPDTASSTTFKPPTGNGFPAVQRRPQNTNPRPAKESRFKASLRQAKTEAPSPTMQAPTNTYSKTHPSDDLHKEIDAQNQQQLESMSEEEILEERQKLMAMLGQDMVSFLTKKGAAPSSRLPEQDLPSAEQAGEMPVAKSSTNRKTRPASLFKAVRFNDAVSFSNPPSRSPSPPPQRHAIPMPAPSSSSTNGLRSSDPTKDEGDDADLAEMIRQRYFPDEPLSTQLDWMRSDASSSAESKVSQESQVRFDLTGKSGSKPSDYQSSESDRHAGSGESMTLRELCDLTQSAVAGQRTLAFQVLRKAIASNRTDNGEGFELLASSDSVTAVIQCCARGLADKSLGVSTAAIAVLEQYAVLERTRLNASAAVLTVKPPVLDSFSYLLSESCDLPHAAALACLRTLLSLLSTPEDYVSSEIVESPYLLENIAKVFLQKPWPPTPSSPLPEPDAIKVLYVIVFKSRSNAETIIGRGIEQSAMRYIAVPPWSLKEPSLRHRAFDLGGHTMRLLAEYGRHGLGSSTCTTSAGLLREIAEFIQDWPLEYPDYTSSWLEMLEAWSVCAIDPHSTTPEHDILWAETQEWGDTLMDIGFKQSEILPLPIFRRLINALTAWMEGAEKHDKAAFQEIKQGLETYAKERLSSAVEDSSTEPVTQDKAKLLLSIKLLVQSAGVDLGQSSSILDRITLESAEPGEGDGGANAATSTANVGGNDEGWITG